MGARQMVRPYSGQHGHTEGVGKYPAEGRVQLIDARESIEEDSVEGSAEDKSQGKSN